MSSIFEPEVVKVLLKNRFSTADKKKAFVIDWDKRVTNRYDSWVKHVKEVPPWLDIQLKWSANVVAYCSLLVSEKTEPLPLDFPILGPRFLPPTYSHYSRRKALKGITPATGYLQPLHILHPFYYPAQDLNRCPKCHSTNMAWNKGWTGGLPRRVHGIDGEEMAYGYQGRCKDCEQNKQEPFCYALTNPAFWEHREHWQIPVDIPIFHQRSAFTRELWNFIVELRLKSTSGALEEHIRQLHLLRYHGLHLEYLNHYDAARADLMASAATSMAPMKSALKQTTLVSAFTKKSSNTEDDPFSLSTTVKLPPFERFKSYDAFDSQGPWSSISDELISEVYSSFHEKTRQSESSEYLKTLFAISVSMDNTFKVAKKAVVVGSDKQRTQLLKGGILTIINELNEIVSWRLCESQSPKEAADMLKGLAKRCEALGVPLPEMGIVDNCCTVRAILQGAIPTLQVFNDICHVIMRYLAIILNGTRNPARNAVAGDISRALLKTRSKNGSGAQYFSKEDQERNLVSVYNKWASKGNVWSAAAPKVHSDQLEHARKGCLTRSRQDVLSDGARIEGSHKGWNSIMRAMPCGLGMFISLSSDFVLRRNIRVGKSRFVLIVTHGSHHVRLANYTAFRHNAILLQQSDTVLAALPTLPKIITSKTFGIVSSAYNRTCDAIGPSPKADADASENDLLVLTALENEDLENPETAAQHLSIDPALLLIPQSQPILASPSSTNVDHPTAEQQFIDVDCNHGADSDSDDGADSDVVMLDLPNHTTLHAEAESSSGSLQTTLGKRSRVREENLSTENKKEEGKTKKSRVQPTTLYSFFDNSTRSTGPNSEGSSMASIGPSLSSPSPLDTKLRNICAPVSPLTQGMTRTQALFAHATGLNPLSLKIDSGNEYFLFMTMREELQWASFAMNPQKWLDATQQYNTRFRDQYPESTTFIIKNPRALMDKLSETESTILARLASGDFRSRGKDTENFWRKHCYAVPLIKVEAKKELLEDGDTPNGTSESRKEGPAKARKVATCSRCKTIMYPGGLKGASNHKRGYCSDGVGQKVDTESIPWPQPLGIFTGGTEFHPLKLLEAIRALYEKQVGNGISGSNLSMEDHAFITLLQKKLRNISDQFVFALEENLNISSSTPDWLFTRIDNVRYLRVDCLASK